MNLQTQFHRMPEKVTVLGHRLDHARSSTLAALATNARRERQQWERILKHPGDRFSLWGKTWRKLPHSNDAIARHVSWLADPTHRQPRGEALWVAVRPGTPIAQLPDLQEIADLRDADPAKWEKFLGHYGLVEYDAKWVVAYLTEHDEYLLRVPLDALNGTATKATLLVAAMEEVTSGTSGAVQSLGVDSGLVFADFLQRKGARPPLWTTDTPPWLQGPRLEEPGALARLVLSWGIEDALAQMEPGSEPVSGGRGIPDSWTLYARGCWPLVVLDTFVHRSRYAPVVKCAASDCSSTVPPGRRRFCSERCRQREKKRRYRRPCAVRTDSRHARTYTFKGEGLGAIR